MRCPACRSENAPDSLACFTCGQSFAPAVKRGTVFGSRYEVIEPLGRGGMSTVYVGRDRVLGDRVAVKVLRPDLSRRPEMIRRFGSEMSAARKLRHPHVCRIYAHGQQDGQLYVCMELVDGVDLKSVLRERRPQGLPAEQAFELSLQLSAGLEALHGAGIVHRDVTAPNVMLDRRGRVRLMDFDVAKHHEAEGTDASTATATGHVLGTPEYISPEYARGERADFRSDIYSLGVLIYEMFTGEVPFRGETPLATILKHLNEPPPLEGPKAAALPPSLVPVLRKALAKRPSERYSTARGIGVALRLARTAHAEHVPPPAPDAPLPALLGALNPVDKTMRLPAVKPAALDTGALKAIPTLIGALGRTPPSVPPPRPPSSGGPPEDPVAVLVRALRSEDQRDRARAARVLGGMGPAAAQAIPVLLEALRDSVEAVRSDAARALERIGPAAQAALAAALRDHDPVVRRIAAEALTRILRHKRGRDDA